MKKNTIIKVELEDNPGWITQYLIWDVKTDGWVKLIYQSRYQVVPYTKSQLISFMKKNNYTQDTLSVALGVSRSTVNRYINGSRAIPDWVFKHLGIAPVKTEFQKDKELEELLKQLKETRDTLSQMIESLGS
jgi:DNA-binding XRE family transcriptional regulator